MALPPLTARLGWLRILNYALSFIVIGVLLWQLARHGAQLQVDAERWSFELTEQHLRNAVQLRSIQRRAEGGTQALLADIGGNPLQWAQNAASVDPLQEAGPAELPGWSFDAERGELRYQPRFADLVARRWRVAAVFDDDNQNGRLDWPEEVPSELVLQALP